MASVSPRTGVPEAAVAGSHRSKSVALGEWRTGGAAAVAAQIPGVSRRTAYRSAPVMEAREDL